MFNLFATYAVVGLVVVLIGFPWIQPYAHLVGQVRSGCPMAIKELAFLFATSPTRTAVLHLVSVVFVWHIRLVGQLAEGWVAA